MSSQRERDFHINVCVTNPNKVCYLIDFSLSKKKEKRIELKQYPQCISSCMNHQ